MSDLQHKLDVGRLIDTAAYHRKIEAEHREKAQDIEARIRQIRCAEISGGIRQ